MKQSLEFVLREINPLHDFESVAWMENEGLLGQGRLNEWMVALLYNHSIIALGMIKSLARGAIYGGVLGAVSGYAQNQDIHAAAVGGAHIGAGCDAVICYLRGKYLGG
jgi:hypothetical protein